MAQYNFILLRKRLKKDRFHKAQVVTEKIVRILAESLIDLRCMRLEIYSEKAWNETDFSG